VGKDRVAANVSQSNTQAATTCCLDVFPFCFGSQETVSLPKWQYCLVPVHGFKPCLLGQSDQVPQKFRLGFWLSCVFLAVFEFRGSVRFQQAWVDLCSCSRAKVRARKVFLATSALPVKTSCLLAATWADCLQKGKCLQLPGHSAHRTCLWLLRALCPLVNW